MKPWLLAGALLAGCATAPPEIHTVRVNVPVPVSCLPAQLPTRPAIMPDAQLKALPDYGFVLELGAERADLLAYTGKLEALIGACK